MSDAPERIWLQLYGDASPDDGPVDYKYDGVTWCWENIFEHDVEYVRADRIAELEAERRWIPVEERLPEDGEAVLGVFPDDPYPPNVDLVLYADGTWWGGFHVPTHWMPLPRVRACGNDAGTG